MFARGDNLFPKELNLLKQPRNVIQQHTQIFILSPPARFLMYCCKFCESVCAAGVWALCHVLCRKIHNFLTTTNMLRDIAQLLCPPAEHIHYVRQKYSVCSLTGNVLHYNKTLNQKMDEVLTFKNIKILLDKQLQRVCSTKCLSYEKLKWDSETKA